MTLILTWQLCSQVIFTQIFLPTDPYLNFVIRTPHPLRFTDDKTGSQKLSDPAKTRENMCHRGGLPPGFSPFAPRRFRTWQDVNRHLCLASLEDRGVGQ